MSRFVVSSPLGLPAGFTGMFVGELSMALGSADLGNELISLTDMRYNAS